MTLIQPQCGVAGNLVMGVKTDANGTMVVQLMQNDGSANVHWDLWSDDNFYPHGPCYRFHSNAYDYVIARGWWNKTVSMVNDGPNAGQFWRVVQDHDGWFALQNVDVTGINLNVPPPYNAPGLAILNYEWSSGAPNEVWKFI